ncbi:translation initiation factor IF-2-like isoform X3 [Nematostella vectensis]|uniref:translation initiation factor IF-2-like isoform X2 n=1 Tax=Nematostella vectensis TaxID=45351 RepID=UPI002076EAE5|nr:translation initiation factor IF-2-like isoform X2 [Nematostella vectensis]XP_048578583.1 translation initiation factor IF-2-like isoform X3 [Nematostella vectensis]
MHSSSVRLSAASDSEGYKMGAISVIILLFFVSFGCCTPEIPRQYARRSYMHMISGKRFGIPFGLPGLYGGFGPAFPFAGYSPGNFPEYGPDGYGWGDDYGADGGGAGPGGYGGYGAWGGGHEVGGWAHHEGFGGFGPGWNQGGCGGCDCDEGCCGGGFDPASDWVMFGEKPADAPSKAGGPMKPSGAGLMKPAAPGLIKADKPAPLKAQSTVGKQWLQAEQKLAALKQKGVGKIVNDPLVSQANENKVSDAAGMSARLEEKQATESSQPSSLAQQTPQAAKQAQPVQQDQGNTAQQNQAIQTNHEKQVQLTAQDQNKQAQPVTQDQNKQAQPVTQDQNKQAQPVTQDQNKQPHHADSGMPKHEILRRSQN